MLVASLRDACTDGLRYTTLRNAVACMVLIAPEGACHAFGMPARVMMTSYPGPDQKQIIMFLKHYVSQT